MDRPKREGARATYPRAALRTARGAAREHRLFVAAGLVERAGDRRYNAAVLLDPDGQIRLLHRKINELDIAHDLYAIGDRLGVVETELGTLGLTICGVSFPVSKVAAQTVLGRDRSEACDSQAKWP